MEHLGFWVTRDGIKPIYKNKSNKNMTPLTYQKVVHNFIGKVHYYCGMWEIILQTLVPSTESTSSKVKLNGKKSNKKCSNKLSGFWTGIFY